jgi:hypothetical protein
MNSDGVAPIKAKSRSGPTEVELCRAKDSRRIRSSKLPQDLEFKYQRELSRFKLEKYKQ